VKAFITSTGEPTTDLCIWALSRNGFEVELILDSSSLWSKLKKIYSRPEDDFLRVDADIIVNKNLTPKLLASLSDPEIWWWQFLTFDWYKQDTTHSMSFIRKAALPFLRSNIDKFQRDLRPETRISRIPEFHDPRRMATIERIMGVHGYGIPDLNPVRELKSRRGQSQDYDFELTDRLNRL
jgi:hypothetical protein